ncbi:toll/interleukin-1 receptor domain-containing protein [Winogradskyella sp.]|uniref:toll/interleukin-1 receptor domain-containing protein n=1 Tax=Winogradskyella sp. TaxID=1883156 RepID=UPI00262163CE|nr:toll/interleukin-1 receptor domain-containing protein [Winogradskyella sp.]
MKGTNKSIRIQGKLISKPSSNSKPCVFLSHKKEDKQACKVIGKYLTSAGIDIFLDEYDKQLQNAVASGNARLIVSRIKEAIDYSTHMLVVISLKTYQSQWVPFEMGYGHSELIDDSKSDGLILNLSLLTLKDIVNHKLPEFMKIAHKIEGIKGLNKYICSLIRQPEQTLISKNLISSHSDIVHPLNNVLDWQL